MNDRHSYSTANSGIRGYRNGGLQVATEIVSRGPTQEQKEARARAEGRAKVTLEQGETTERFEGHRA